METNWTNTESSKRETCKNSQENATFTSRWRFYPTGQNRTPTFFHSLFLSDSQNTTLPSFSGYLSLQLSYETWPSPGEIRQPKISAFDQLQHIDIRMSINNLWPGKYIKSWVQISKLVKTCSRKGKSKNTSHVQVWINPMERTIHVIYSKFIVNQV